MQQALWRPKLTKDLDQTTEPEDERPSLSMAAGSEHAIPALRSLSRMVFRGVRTPRIVHCHEFAGTWVPIRGYRHLCLIDENESVRLTPGSSARGRRWQRRQTGLVGQVALGVPTDAETCGGRIGRLGQTTLARMFPLASAGGSATCGLASGVCYGSGSGVSPARFARPIKGKSCWHAPG